MCHGFRPFNHCGILFWDTLLFVKVLYKCAVKKVIAGLWKWSDYHRGELNYCSVHYLMSPCSIPFFPAATSTTVLTEHREGWNLQVFHIWILYSWVSKLKYNTLNLFSVAFYLVSSDSSFQPAKILLYLHCAFQHIYSPRPWHQACLPYLLPLIIDKKVEIGTRAEPWSKIWGGDWQKNWNNFTCNNIHEDSSPICWSGLPLLTEACFWELHSLEVFPHFLFKTTLWKYNWHTNNHPSTNEWEFPSWFSG